VSQGYQSLDGPSRDASTTAASHTQKGVADVKVEEVMTTPVGVVSGESTVRDAAAMMKKTAASALAVQGKKGDPYGVITDRDLVLRVLAEGRGSATEVGEVCSLPTVTVGPDDEVEHALDLMKRHRVPALPVVDGNNVLGTVSMVGIAEAQSAVASNALASANGLKS
jgi:CBS domain-containing protein